MQSNIYNISKSTSPDGTQVTYTFLEENSYGDWAAILTNAYYDNYDIIPGNYYLLTVRFRPIGNRGVLIGLLPYSANPYVFIPSRGVASQGAPGIVKYKQVAGGFYEINIFFKATNILSQQIATGGGYIALRIVNEKGEVEYEGSRSAGIAVSKFALVEYPSNTELAPDGFPAIMPQIGDVNAISPHNFLKWSTNLEETVWSSNSGGFTISSGTWYNDGSTVHWEKTYNNEKDIYVLEYDGSNSTYMFIADRYANEIPENQMVPGERYTLSFFLYLSDLSGEWENTAFNVGVDWGNNPDTVQFKIPDWKNSPSTKFIEINPPSGSTIEAGILRAQPEFDARGPWYRVWVSDICSDYPYSIGVILQVTSEMGKPNQSDKLYLYGPQFERGPTPGIYVPTRGNIVLPNPKVKFTYDGYKWVPYPLDPYRGGDGRNRIPSQYAGGWNNPKSVETSPTYDETWFESSIEAGNPPYEYRAFPEAGFTGNYPLRITAKTKKELIVENVFRSPTTSRATVKIPGYQSDWGVGTRLAFAYLKGGTSTVGDANGVWGSILSPLIDANRFTFSISGSSTGLTSTFPNILDGNYTKNSGILVEKEKASDYGGAVGLIYLANSNTLFNIPIDPFQVWIFSYYFHSTGRFDVWADMDALEVVVETENGQIEVIKIEEENIIDVRTYPAYYEGWVRVSAILDFSRNPSTSARIYIRGPNYYTNGFQAYYFDGFMLEKKIGLKNDPSPWTSELGPEAIEESEIKTDQIQRGDLPGGMTLGGGEILTVQEEGEAFDGVPIDYKYEYRVPPRVVYLLGGITYNPILSTSISYLVAEVDNNTPTGFTPVLKLSSKLIDSDSKVELTTVTTDDSYQKRIWKPTHLLIKAGSLEANSQTYLFRIQLNIQNLRGKRYVEGLSLPIAGSVLLEFFYDKGPGWASLGTRLYTGRSVVSEPITSITGDVSFFIPGAGSGTKFGIAIQRDSGVSKTYKMPGSTIQGFAVEYYTASSGGSEVPATIAGGRGITYFISGEKYVEGEYED